jgi:hypothetical protein
MGFHVWDVPLPQAARYIVDCARRGHRLNVLPSEAVIPPAQPQTLAQLRHRFEPEIRELESLLDRTLSPWLRQH